LDLRRVGKLLMAMALSLVCGGGFYTAWLAAYLLVARLDQQAVDIILWLLAPVITAAGFALGMALAERWTRRARTPFLRLYAWPLVGCAVGAGAVYPFGPMLIVFGMLTAGTASVGLREGLRLLRG
jgi:hypothetical protein